MTGDESISFEPFFDEFVKITARRQSGTFSGGFKACVMPIDNSSDILDTSAQEGILKFSVLIPIRGDGAWIESAIGHRPQVGDVIELKNGMKTSVCKVSPIVDSWWEMEARQC